MKNNKNSASTLSMSNLYVKNFSFSRTETLNTFEPTFNLVPHFDIDGNDVVASLKFTLQIENDAEYCNLDVTVVGVFFLEESGENEISDSFKEIVFTRNTLAIIFPYLRSQITLLTTQPGMQPIILPPINIAKFLEDFKQDNKS